MQGAKATLVQMHSKSCPNQPSRDLLQDLHMFVERLSHHQNVVQINVHMLLHVAQDLIKEDNRLILLSMVDIMTRRGSQEHFGFAFEDHTEVLSRIGDIQIVL